MEDLSALRGTGFFFCVGNTSNHHVISHEHFFFAACGSFVYAVEV